jgi:hypothetical protein
MSSLSRPRLLGLVAVIGGTVGVLYAPLYAMAYFATPDGASSLQESPIAAAWSSALRPLVEPLVSFAAPEIVYLTYGKLFSVMVLGWMCGLVVLHGRERSRSSRVERWGFGIALAGTVVATIGGIGVYWLGTFWWGLVDVFFIFAMIPAILLVGIGMPLFGVGLLRSGGASRLGAWLLVLGGLPGILALTAVLGQLTLGMLVLNVAWIVLGATVARPPALAGQVLTRAG